MPHSNSYGLNLKTGVIIMKIILSLFLLTGAIYGADLSRDSQEIVTDISKKLEWQDNTSIQKQWIQAISYCEDLSLGGHDDWRLPNRRELISIVDYAKHTPAIKESVFQNIIPSYYWSSSSYATDSSYAWTVRFSNGRANRGNKTANLYVRCLRDQQ